MSKQTPLTKYSTPNQNVAFHDLISPISHDDLIIFPTALLAHHYKAELIRRNIPHNPDRITTLSDFCRKYHDDQSKLTRVISDGQALLILTTTLERIKTDIPFFFNQGNPSSGTIKDLYALRSILSQRSICFSSHPLVSTSEKCRQISLALAAYQQTLTDNNFLDSPGLIEWTIQDITSKTEPIFNSVRIHQLFEIFPRDKTLIQTIREHAKSFQYEFLPGKDPEIFSLPEWINPDEAIRIAPSPGHFTHSDLFTNNPDLIPDEFIRIQLFTSPNEEFESIAEEIHALADDGTPLEDIVITYPKISEVASSLQETLEDFGIPSYSYVGEPLIREPIIGFLLQFPSLVTDAFPREDIISLISSPFFQIDQQHLPKISVAEFDYIVRTAGIEGGYSWDESLEALKKLPENANQSLPRIPNEKIDIIITWIREIQTDCNHLKENLTPAGYAALFRRLCRKWMRPEFQTHPVKSEDPLLIREIQAYKQFLGCLTRLITLLGSEEPIQLSQFIRFFIYILEEPVNLTPDSGGVRIMGLRQIVGMEYSCIFLGGLIEGDIPYPSTRIPLLTSPESEQLGSRGLDEVIKGERYYFISTLAAGKKVWLSAPKTRGERKVLTSSFFEQVKRVKNPLEWGREIVHSQRRAAIRAGKSIGKRGESSDSDLFDPLTWLGSDQIYGSVAIRILIEDWYRTGTPNSVYDGILSENDEVLTWLSDSRMFGPERIWSPTQLETYANCPFRFFLDRVIRVTPFPEVDPTLSPARKGSLIHDTLCEFYRKWCEINPRRVTHQNLTEASDLLKAIGSEMSGKYQYQSPVWHATIASLLGFDGIPGIYERFLSYESRRETTLRPELFEFPIGIRQKNADEKTDYILLESDEGEPVRIRGRIDRVDITSEGEFAIIDYKSGSNYPNGQRIIEGKALQLPLYLLALEKMYQYENQPKKGIGGSYFEIGKNIKQTWPLLDPDKKTLAGVSARAKGTSDFREVTRGSLAAAQQYITDIRRGIFPVTREKCTISAYCVYSGICRLDKFRVAEEEERGGE